MGLFETINDDIKAAMLAKEKEKLEALRAIKAALLLAKTEKSASHDLTPDIEMKVLQRMVKQRKESAEIYQSQNRPDLAEKELFEASVIEQYLPARMSAEDLEKTIREIIARVGAKSPADMGKVMGVATKELAGKAEGKDIAETVKKILASL